MPGKSLPDADSASRPGYIRGAARFDVVTRLKGQARYSRRMARTEPHLAGYYENLAQSLEMAIDEIVRLRALGLK